MIRLLTLYLRTRQVPWSLPAAVAGVGVVALLGNSPDRPLQTAVFSILALALGFGVLGYGLGGADAALERTGSIRWFWWRMAHLAGMTAVMLAAAVATFATPAGILVRDAAGLAGLTALAASALGHQLAWTLPVGWAGASVVIPPLGEPTLLAVLTWPMQAPESKPALVTAIVLALAGALTYAVRGHRPSTTDRQSRFRAAARS